MKKIKIGIQEPYKTFLINGKKVIEGRLNKGKFSSLENGDILEIEDNKNEFKIIELKKYNTFKDMLFIEGIKNVLPDKENIEDGLEVYYKFYNKQDEKKFGVLSVKLELIK